MPTLVSTGQITITDQNDYIFTGTTPPANPIVGLTLWVDTSVSPNHLKRWNGTSWEIVNEVKVGGTNLLPNSSFEDGFNGWANHGVARAENSDQGYEGGNCLYLPAISNYDGLQLRNFVCEAGQVYTFSCMVRVITRGNIVILGWKDSNVSAIRTQLATLPLNQWQKVHITFTGDGTSNTVFLVSRGYELFIDHVKLEKGNQPTDWSPSPNDTIRVSSRNLLINSGIPFTSTAYLMKHYFLTQLLPNHKYTVVVKASMSAGQHLGVYWNAGNGGSAVAFSKLTGVQIYYAHIQSPSTITHHSITLFNMPNTGAVATVYYACLYEGHVSPPIDWSPAPEDVFGRLDDISSDNKFTPDEKYATLKEWQSIQGEVSAIRSQADLFGVSRTVYDATYSALSSYITPLLSNLSETSDVVGSTFRSKFNDYYNARTNLLLAISQKQKSDFDDLEIGGENIATNTNFTITALSSETHKSEVIKGSKTSFVITKPDTYLINGRNYVLSIGAIKRILGTATKVHCIIYDFTSNSSSGNFYHLFDVSNNPQVATFTVPSSGNWSLIVYAGQISNTNNNSIVFENVMLQLGNKATSYTPATKYLTEAFQGSTEIEGGLVSTNLLLMKNSSDQVTAGVSGLSTDNLGFWTGGTYEDALAGLAKFIVTKDGSAKLSGIVEAMGGKIGGLNIFSNTLKSSSMAFSETPVEQLSSLLTPTLVSISQQASWESLVINQTALAYSQPIVVTVDSQIRFRATCTPSTLRELHDRWWSVSVEQGGGGDVIFLQGGRGSITSQLFIVNVPPGTYIIKAMAAAQLAIGETHVNQASITGESSSIIYASGFNFQTKIGNNGFYSFWSDLLYFYFSNTHGLEVKGQTNIPGVLASGSISSSGAQTNSWGAKKNSLNATYTATGIYDVRHTAGSAYQVTIQPTVDNVRASVVSKGNNIFRVQLRNNSGTATTGSFDYVIFGSN